MRLVLRVPLTVVEQLLLPHQFAGRSHLGTLVAACYIPSPGLASSITYEYPSAAHPVHRIWEWRLQRLDACSGDASLGRQPAHAQVRENPSCRTGTSVLGPYLPV